jgi:hypothetical protein
MNVARILQFRLGSEPLDAWLSRWGCTLGGLGLCGLAVVALRQHATSASEFLLGTMAAGVACLTLILLGALARQVHLVLCESWASWRSRRWELLAHGVGLVVLGLGAWALASVSVGIAGTVSGGLLILAAYAAILSLGCWSTLAGRSEQVAALDAGFARHDAIQGGPGK